MSSNAPNAILAISSTDRYISSPNGNASQPVSNTLVAEYNNAPPYSNDFSITAPNALMNGYIQKMIVSQIQLQYNLPTVVPGGNDVIFVWIETGTSTNAFISNQIELPYGFYVPSDLAAMFAYTLNTVYNVLFNPGPSIRVNPFEVFYNQGTTTTAANVGFSVFLNEAISGARRFYFGTPDQLDAQNVGFSTQLLKAYKLFGFTRANRSPGTIQLSQRSPQFLYTPYIDLYSDQLTNYQKLKDTDSSTIRRKGLISRMYLSGVGNPQATTGPVATEFSFATKDVAGQTLSNSTGQTLSYGSSLGSAPFVLTFDLNSPKVINWTPDTAVNSLDFQMRDCYGDLLFSAVPGLSLAISEVFNTEWQMTLLCVEGGR